MTEPWEEDWSGDPVETAGPWDDFVEDETKSSGVISKLKSSLSAAFWGTVGRGEAVLGTAGAIAAPVAGGLIGGADQLYQWGKAIPGVPGEPDYNRPPDLVRSIEERIAGFTTPRTEEGKSSMETVGKTFKGAADVIKYPMSGYVGMMGGAQEAEKFREEPMGEYLGDKAMEATGSPAFATAARVLPDAALAATGIRTASKMKDLRTPRPERGFDLPEGYGGVAPEVPGVGPKPWRGPEQPTAPKSQFGEVEAALKKQSPEEAAKVIDANPAMVAAFDELGIEYSPGMVSESQAFRQVQSGIKSKAESGLAAVDEKVLTDLTNTVDELINRFGTTNRTALDEGLRAEFDAIVLRLEGRSDQAFKKVNAAVPAGERIAVEEVRGFIRQRIEDLGAGNITEGLKEASKAENRLFQMTHRKVQKKQTDAASGESRIIEEWEAKDPSYAALDAYRKDIGNSLGGTGPFRDADIAALNNMYGLLARAQQGAATQYGVGATYRSGNKFVALRKAVEDSAVKVLGRNLERGSLSQIDAAAAAIVKGDINKFRSLMKNTPKRLRQSVAAAVINDLFAPGAQKGVGIKQGFLDNVKALKRNPEAMNELFSYLPTQARQRFDVISKASEGFFRSLLKDNRSNTANGVDVINSINSGGMVSKLYGLAEGLPMVGDWLARIRPKNTRLEATDAFIRSEGLNQAVREYAAGRYDRANQIVEGSSAYKRWLQFADENSKAQIAQSGFIAWLITGDSGE